MPTSPVTSGTRPIQPHGVCGPMNTREMSDEACDDAQGAVEIAFVAGHDRVSLSPNMSRS
jgi:hypothetical protein